MLMTLMARKDFMVFKQGDLLLSQNRLTSPLANNYYLRKAKLMLNNRLGDYSTIL